MTLAIPSDPHMSSVMAHRKTIDEILTKKKKFFTGIWAPGSEAEATQMKWHATWMFHWAKKTLTFKRDYPNYEIIPEDNMSETTESVPLRLRPLQFEYEGKFYAIEFRRFTKDGPDHLKRRMGRNPQTKPFTEVNIREGLKRDSYIYRTWTVGCWHRDNFNGEKGRISALRMALKGNSDKSFSAAVFNCYFNRFNVGDIDAPIPDESI